MNVEWSEVMIRLKCTCYHWFTVL